MIAETEVYAAVQSGARIPFRSPLFEALLDEVSGFHDASFYALRREGGVSKVIIDQVHFYSMNDYDPFGPLGCWLVMPIAAKDHATLVRVFRSDQEISALDDPRPLLGGSDFDHTLGRVAFDTQFGDRHAFPTDFDQCFAQFAPLPD